MMSFYVTTPIFYVNDVPHLGHAYTSIAADVMARTARLLGKEAFFLTGTDEHGQKVEKSAEAAGESPQAFVDRVSQSFRALTPLLNLSNDGFIRTTDPAHRAGAQAFWKLLEKKGYIYKGFYEGWYSVRDEAFYAGSEIIDGKAPTGAPVEWVKEPSYFFKMSAFQEKLLSFYEKHPNFIQPSGRRNEVISFVRAGLQDLSISRTSFRWGVPVPGDEAHVMYVWLDALTNYITALGYPEETSDFKKFWPGLHLIGKDILRFHAIYWPAFLMAADLPLPKAIYAHGWWTVEGQKMSKSLGNALNPESLINTYGLDPLRYFLLRQVPFGQDGDFSDEAMIGRLNGDLANDLGNLAQRVLVFIQKNANACVPTPGLLTAQDQKLIEQTQGLWKILNQHVLEDYQLHRYLEKVWEVIAEANRYVDYQAPWSLRKSDPERMETVLYVLCEVLRTLSRILWPIMPHTMDRLFASLGNPTDTLKPGEPLPMPEVLFLKCSPL